SPFKEHIEYQDACIVLAGTGGKLTMLTESGSGTLAGGAHTDSWDEVVSGEAAEISEIFQAQLDKPELQRMHPGEPVLAWFEFSFNEETDSSQVITEVQGLATAGYEVDPAEIQERTGYRVSLRTAGNAFGQPGVGGYGQPGAYGFNRLRPGRMAHMANREAGAAQQLAVRQHTDEVEKIA